MSMQTSNDVSNIQGLVLKLESKTKGPLFKIVENDNQENFLDSDLKIEGEDRYYAVWFSLSEAKRIAKELNVELETC